MRKETDKRASSPALRFTLVLLGGLICAALAYYVQYRPEKENALLAAGPAAAVRFNEAMSQNRRLLADDRGVYSDWIELINEEGEEISLSGWRLVRVDKPEAVFTFPEMELGSGECALVFASGQDRPSALHAPFRLSASGGQLALFDANGAQADALELPALSADESFARDEDGEWHATMQCTPGLPNVEENAVERVVVEDAVCLSEVVARNVSLVPGGNDLIELTNRSDHPVSLAGYCLSDSAAHPDKYVLDDISLAPGEFLLIEVDGKDVPFRLSGGGEEVLLTSPSGALIGHAVWEDLGADRSLSFVDGDWTKDFPASPGQPNTLGGAMALEARLAETNPTGVLFSEAMASARGEYDWVELYNGGESAADLSGMGLSDNPAHPRKWQFPEGVSIQPGEYLVLQLSGQDMVDRNGRRHVPFRLSCREPETLTLSLPSGEIVDRMSLPCMYGDISVGRVSGEEGLRYFAEATAGAPNAGASYGGRVEKPAFSADGGLFASGQKVTLSISVPAGATVRYTLDCSEPTESSPLYSRPIELNDTAIVRAKAFAEGRIPSYTETQSYLFGVRHTVRVVSVVSDPDGLFGDERGIMVIGKNGMDVEPYTGANFWKSWEREAHVEVFDEDGRTLVGQGCGLRLQGANTRKRPQKAMTLSARMTYDEDNRFRRRIFREREYAEYKEFVLRAGGQDDETSRIRDLLLDRLAASTEVLYQEGELCVVYLNGEYWGQYEMREKINRFSIAQFEDWDPQDRISVVREASVVRRGSDEDYQELMDWTRAHGDAADEDIAYVETHVDLDNYLDFVCLMIYSGNQDIGLRRYRNADADGLWRWVVFDMDYAFTNDTDSMRRWLDPAGAGTNNRSDNRLFVYVMRNEGVKRRFLRRFGELVTGPWAADNVVGAIQALHDEMLPEMEKHYERWTASSMERWEKQIRKLTEFAATRQEKITGYVQQYFDLSGEEMKEYFGGGNG